MVSPPPGIEPQTLTEEINQIEQRERWIWLSVLVISVAMILGGILGLSGVNVFVYAGTFASSFLVTSGALLLTSAIFSLLSIRVRSAHD